MEKGLAEEGAKGEKEGTIISTKEPDA